MILLFQFFVAFFSCGGTSLFVFKIFSQGFLGEPVFWGLEVLGVEHFEVVAFLRLGVCWVRFWVWSTSFFGGDGTVPLGLGAFG